MLNKLSRTLVFCFILALLAVFQVKSIYATDNGLILNYKFTVKDPSSHLVSIQLEIDNISTAQLSIHRQTPNNINPTIFNFSCKNQNGSDCSYEKNAISNLCESYTIYTGMDSTITIKYDVNLEYTAQDPQGGYSYWNLDSNFGAVEAQYIFLQPMGDNKVSKCKVYTYLPSGWKVASRLIDKVNYLEANVDDIVSVGSNNDFVIWGPLAFGNLEFYNRTIGGVDVDIVFIGDKYANEEISDNAFSIFQYYSDFIGPLNDPPNSTEPIKYVYVYISDTEKRVWSRDHIYGEILTLTEPDIHYLYRTFAHILAHTWFSHFELIADVIHVEPWMEESIIQFFALKSLEYTGIWNASEVNEHLKAWYEDYETFILGAEYDVAVYPMSNWFNFPNEHLDSIYTYGIRNIIWYEKIPLIFWLLDQEIQKVTIGKNSIYDVWKYFHAESSSTMYERIDYDKLLNTCNLIGGADFSNFFSTYFRGTTQLPIISMPYINIEANGQQGAISVSSTDSVSIKITIDPSYRASHLADWWIAVNTPFDPPGNWYTFVNKKGWIQGIEPFTQTGLVELPLSEVLNMPLPVGRYVFYFAIDDPDGKPTGPWWMIGSVEVIVE